MGKFGMIVMTLPTIQMPLLKQGHMSRIKSDREGDEGSYTSLEQFDRRIIEELLELDVAISNAEEFFTSIESERQKGENINNRLRQLNITYEEFRELWKVRELAEAQTTILEDEWHTVYSILTAAHKRRKYADWRDEDRSYTYSSTEYNICLSPDFFRIPNPKPVEFPPIEDVPLPKYLVSEQNKTLLARYSKIPNRSGRNCDKRN